MERLRDPQLRQRVVETMAGRRRLPDGGLQQIDRLREATCEREGVSERRRERWHPDVDVEAAAVRDAALQDSNGLLRLALTQPEDSHSERAVRQAPRLADGLRETLRLVRQSGRLAEPPKLDQA